MDVAGLRDTGQPGDTDSMENSLAHKNGKLLVGNLFVVHVGRLQMVVVVVVGISHKV
jgi:hypothetical protein